jgi:two-component system response regulator GlrR
MSRQTSAGKILLVDDDKNLIELLKMRLESAKYEVAAAFKEEDALEAIIGQAFDLSIVDLKLFHQDGIMLMEKLHSINPGLPVIILTAHGSIESAVEAIKRGAYTYLTKPFDSRDLLLQIEKAVENRKLTSEINRLRGLLAERYNFANIVARSQKMQRVLNVVSRIAKTESTVFVYGESGSGKELIAKAIHIASERKDEPFVAINCAAIPETLLESELFGHDKGAFTGAIRNSKGLMTQAHGGTIFLDEIAEMPLSLQAKLLRALQERQFYPIGGEKPIEVDVRIIVAAKNDLKEEVSKGLFREDLFYRIHVIPIHLPPLRERKEDIPYLTEHFLKKFNKQMKKEVRALTPQSMQRLMLYDWPGNVRELENTIEYAMAMTQQDIITELILPTKITLQEQFKPIKEASEAVSLKGLERSAIIKALSQVGNNAPQAAKRLGISKATLYRKLKEYDISP